ncbi:MAG: hypothetical protein V1771_03440 [Chloroflexota bacterium]
MGSQTSDKALTTKDSEAISYLKQSIAAGEHWYRALLGAMGRWGSAEEDRNGRRYQFLIAGEAFDWLLLAERLCEEVDGLILAAEKEKLLFYGRPPLLLTVDQVRELIGSTKYKQYLNYFYGITVEMELILAVQGEVHKERWMLGLGKEADAIDEAYRRIYGATRSTLLRCFRKERGYPQLKSISIEELKEFTYYLFKYRLDHCEKSKVASDTKKALERLGQYWKISGLAGERTTFTGSA